MRIVHSALGRAAGLLLLMVPGLAGAIAPASAFDRFERLLPALAASTGGMSYDEVFRYIGFGGGPPEAYFKSANAPLSSGVLALDKALSESKAAGELTGVRLDQVQAALVHGRPPGDVIVMLGPKGFAAGAPGVLEKRGFEKAVAGGIEMHRIGEDFSISLARRSPVDPFGYGLGSAQRVVVLDEFVVAARGTSYASLAATPLVRPVSCVTCRTIGALVEAIRPVAGPRAQLRVATAYSSRAFLAADDPATVLADKSGAPIDAAELKRRTEAIRSARARLPVFGVALFANTVADGGQALHIALSFAGAADAERALRAIAERLGAKTWGTTRGQVARGAQLPARAEIKTSVAGAGPGFAALVTVTHPGEPANASVREFAIWHRMIMDRDFWPLQILE